MRRKDILNDCPEGHEDFVEGILDYFESKFNEIKDKLSITQLSDLSNIEDAYSIAASVCDDLY